MHQIQFDYEAVTSAKHKNRESNRNGGHSIYPKRKIISLWFCYLCSKILMENRVACVFMSIFFFYIKNIPITSVFNLNECRILNI